MRGSDALVALQHLPQLNLGKAPCRIGSCKTASLATTEFHIETIEGFLLVRTQARFRLLLANGGACGLVSLCSFGESLNVLYPES
ncbi:hypothetical protein SPHINGO361_140019 [Sphingomonas sp. EC-HK361]|nr:hypothetical protein SPHINGO361_140019 [Sphingomonas sp. EC-HK361]